MADELVKKPETGVSSEADKDKLAGVGSGKIGGSRGLSGLHNRLNKATASAPEPAMAANRIVLMLDVSGSMAGRDAGVGESYETAKTKIDHLKDAVQGFIACCNFADTAVGIETFGARDAELHVPLVNNSGLLTMSALTLQAHGGTPMHNAMEATLKNHALTRGVIVSDGDADRAESARMLAEQYAEAQIPIDTVHIGHSSSGAELLQHIAERTGGVFIKFEDVGSFGKNFKYLTPAYRGMLTSGSVTAAMLGAKETK